ncbi:hypothetical protein Rs2_29075 [Raphanus sativus]|nr:hypothetical protein Rs2_29075 [Raphanus sativus]
MYLQQLVEIVEILEKCKQDINKFQQDLNKINKKLEQDFCTALNKFDEALKKREAARAQDVQLDDDEDEERFIEEDICVVDSVYKNEVCAKLGQDEICMYLQQQQLVEIVEILEKCKQDINKFQQDLNKINKKLEQDFYTALNKFDEALKKREAARAQDVQLDDDEDEERFIEEDICVVDSVYKDEVCAKLGHDEICVNSIPKSFRYIINRNNPCGNVYSHDHLHKVAETARKLGIILIVDEVYDKTIFGDNPFVPMAKFASIVPVLTLGGISKGWVVPGRKIGWIALNDPEGVFESTKVAQSIKQSLDITPDPSTIIQAALPEILEKVDKNFFAKKNKILKHNVDLVCDRLKDIPCVVCPKKPALQENSDILRDIPREQNFLGNF